MTGRQKRSLLRQSHRWVGWVIALVVLVVVGSGIVLQHPAWLGPKPNPALSLAVDPTDPARLLRGTHWGVEVSSDGGVSWQEVPMLAAPTDVRRILFVPDAPGAGVVYALGTRSLVVSTDGGRIWQDVPTPTAERLLTASFLDLSVSATGALNLLTTAGQYRRTGGKAWALVGDPPELERPWRQWVHDLHTGHLGGWLGRRVVEVAAWGLLLLTVTGLELHRRVRQRNKI